MNIHVSNDLASTGARPTVLAIAKLLAARRGIPFSELISHRREKKLALARMEAMYLAKRLSNRTLPEIARVLGDRDHTTILHGIRRIGELATNDGAYLAEITAIEQSIATDLGTAYVFPDMCSEAKKLATAILEQQDALQVSLPDIRNLAAMFLEFERRDNRLVKSDDAGNPSKRAMSDAEIVHYVPTRSIPVADLRPLFNAVAKMEDAVFTPGEAHERSRVIQEAVLLKNGLRK